MISVWLNGEQKKVTTGLTVDGLLDELGIPKEVVIVERNRKALKKEQFCSEPIEDGDQLELIRLMGGG